MRFYSKKKSEELIFGKFEAPQKQLPKVVGVWFLE